MYSTTDFIRFHPGHVHLLGGDLTELTAIPHDRIIAQAAHGTAWTMLVDRRVSAVGGTTRLWDGLGEVWMLANPDARRHPVSLTRFAIDAIDYTMQSLRLRRLQAHVKTSDRRAMRWAEFIGMTREATLRCYGQDGSDYDLFSKLR